MLYIRYNSSCKIYTYLYVMHGINVHAHWMDDDRHDNDGNDCNDKKENGDNVHAHWFDDDNDDNDDNDNNK